MLDGHLTPGSEPGVSTLDAFTRINRALGVLIERGRTPVSARAELMRLAGRDGDELHHAADRVVASTAG